MIDRARAKFSLIALLVIAAGAFLGAVVVYHINVVRDYSAVPQGGWAVHQINQVTRKTEIALIEFQAEPSEKNLGQVRFGVDLLWSRFADEQSMFFGDLRKDSAVLSAYIVRYETLLQRLDRETVDLTPDMAGLLIDDLRAFYDDTHGVMLEVSERYHRNLHDLHETTQRQLNIAVIFFALFFLSVAGSFVFLLRMLRKSDVLATEIDQSRNRIKNLASMGSDWYWETGPDHRLLLTSPSLFRDKRKHRTFSTIQVGALHDDITDEDTSSPKWQNHLQRLAAREPFEDFQYTISDGAGGQLVMCSSGVPYFDANGDFCGYYGTTRDETAFIDLQKQLQVSQRIEALGQLSSGIAHDFNNLLTVFVSNIEILRQDPKLGSEVDLHVDRLMDAVRKGQTVTKRLLAFNGTGVEQRDRVDLNNLLRDFVDVATRTLPGTIQIDLSLSGEPLEVLINGSELDHILLNLVLNARDAMPNGGTIQITGRRYCRTMNDDHEEFDEPDVIEIGIRDQGDGMSPDVLERCMVPLFTTKPKGEGTGLGLSIVYSLIKASGGDMRISSVPGQGTEVSVQLRPAKSPVESQPEMGGFKEEFSGLPEPQFRQDVARGVF